MSQATLEAPPRPGDEHQAGQAALVALIPAVLREAWPLLDLHNLQATMPQFEAAVHAIVQRYGKASAAGALAYYQAERQTAAVPGRAPLALAPTPADSVIESAVSWATTDLWGPVSPEVTSAAMARLDESVSQLVLDQGRQTIIGAVKADKYAKGWARVTEPGACSFCQMLALRAGAGFLYKRQATADFQVHDNCRCHAEPVFTAYEPSARMREMQATWAEATKGRYGADARAAFRQALEGRPVTGAPNVRKAKAAAAKAKGTTSPAATLGKSTMTRAQAEHQLAILQGLKDSKYRTEQMARMNKLLAGKWPSNRIRESVACRGGGRDRHTASRLVRGSHTTSLEDTAMAEESAEATAAATAAAEATATETAAAAGNAGESAAAGAASPWDDPAAAKAEIERLRKENGATRTNAKAQAADDARAALAQEIGKALGLVKDDEPADPVKLTEQLTAAGAEARQAKIELAVFRAAQATDADPNALLDSRVFLAKLADVDPSDSAAVTAAITEAVTANPRLGKPEVAGSGMKPNLAQGRSATPPLGLAEQIAVSEKAGDTKATIRLKSAMAMNNSN